MLVSIMGGSWGTGENPHGYQENMQTPKGDLKVELLQFTQRKEQTIVNSFLFLSNKIN